MEVGQEVFHQGGLSYGSAAVKKFDKLLTGTFGKQRHSQTLRPVLIPTYDVDLRKLVVFKTRSALSDNSKDPMLVQVCRATTAIEPVFPQYTMTYHGRKMRCVDAGYHLKNPALSALAEVWKHKDYYAGPGLREEDIVLVSISTGSYHNRAADWSTDIGEVLHSQKMDMKYIVSQKLDIDFERVRFLRVDMNLGGSSFSMMQLLKWLARIEALSQDKQFRKTTYDLLVQKVRS